MGERIVVDSTEFRVGADRESQVYFDPRLDPAAQHRAVLIRLSTDGWVVRSVGGGEVLLNQTPIAGEIRIRSGDLVRLSDRGPDFSFSLAITSQPKNVVQAVSHHEADRRPAAPETCQGTAAAIAAESSDASGDRGPNTERPKPSAEPVPGRWKRVASAAAVSAALTVLLGIGFVGLRRHPQESARATQEGALEIEDVASRSVSEGSKVTLQVHVRLTGTLYGRPVFALAHESPNGAAIDQKTGMFTWTPTEKDGPGQYTFHVRVTLEKAEAVSAESQFRIDVTEVNSPLSIKPVQEKDVDAGQEITFTLATEDADQPANARAFRLIAGPEWISIDPASGVVRCSPPKSVDGRFDVTIRARDNGAPPLEDQATFAVVVHGDPWLHLQQELQESLYMVQLQRSGPSGDYTWPFATCSAIGGRTLLSSAHEVLLLASFCERGYHVLAVNPATGFKTTIRSFRVSREFADLVDAPGDWIFVNMGLLETEHELPKSIPLATPEELASLEEGLPVTCFGYPHDGSKITRFDTFKSQGALGEVYVISSLTCQQKVARLMELKGKIPNNFFGSPILNKRGAIVAVYGRSAPQGMTSVQDLHYAPIPDLESVQSWLRGADNGDWVTPPSTETASPSRDQPSDKLK